MKKYAVDLLVAANEFLDATHFLIVLRKVDAHEAWPEVWPGQFVEVLVEGSSSTFLRRPISVNYVDAEKGELWLLVQAKGEGTNRLANLRPGDLLNVVFPLGHGFTMPKAGERLLLIGGGVGVAPMLYFGKRLLERQMEPSFLLGARTAEGLLELEQFLELGRVFVTTEDGSAGEQGFVTQHSIWKEERFDRLAVCGPKPMMVAVAKMAKQWGIDCEVSLENLMACGLGACLCCVEPTVKGNLRACKEGPVFNINDLLWQI